MPPQEAQKRPSWNEVAVEGLHRLRCELIRLARNGCRQTHDFTGFTPPYDYGFPVRRTYREFYSSAAENEHSQRIFSLNKKDCALGINRCGRNCVDSGMNPTRKIAKKLLFVQRTAHPGLTELEAVCGRCDQFSALSTTFFLWHN